MLEIPTRAQRNHKDRLIAMKMLYTRSVRYSTPGAKGNPGACILPAEPTTPTVEAVQGIPNASDPMDACLVGTIYRRNGDANNQIVSPTRDR
jgi:hypothetical protein